MSRSGDELYSRDQRIGRSLDSDEAVSVLNLARGVSQTAPLAAVQELGNAELGIATCVSTGQTDGDLLSTISRFTTTDSAALAKAAYPGSEKEQSSALGKIQNTAKALDVQKAKRGLSDRIQQRVEAIKKRPGEVRSNAPRLDKETKTHRQFAHVDFPVPWGSRDTDVQRVIDHGPPTRGMYLRNLPA